MTRKRAPRARKGRPQANRAPPRPRPAVVNIRTGSATALPESKVFNAIQNTSRVAGLKLPDLGKQGPMKANVARGVLEAEVSGTHMIVTAANCRFAKHYLLSDTGAEYYQCSSVPRQDESGVLARHNLSSTVAVAYNVSRDESGGGVAMQQVPQLPPVKEWTEDNIDEIVGFASGEAKNGVPLNGHAVNGALGGGWISLNDGGQEQVFPEDGTATTYGRSIDLVTDTSRTDNTTTGQEGQDGPIMYQTTELVNNLGDNLHDCPTSFGDVTLDTSGFFWIGGVSVNTTGMVLVHQAILRALGVTYIIPIASNMASTFNSSVAGALQAVVSVDNSVRVRPAIEAWLQNEVANGMPLATAHAIRASDILGFRWQWGSDPTDTFMGYSAGTTVHAMDAGIFSYHLTYHHNLDMLSGAHVTRVSVPSGKTFNLKFYISQLCVYHLDSKISDFGGDQLLMPVADARLKALLSYQSTHQPLSAGSVQMAPAVTGSASSIGSFFRNALSTTRDVFQPLIKTGLGQLAGHAMNALLGSLGDVYEFTEHDAIQLDSSHHLLAVCPTAALHHFPNNTDERSAVLTYAFRGMRDGQRHLWTHAVSIGGKWHLADDKLVPAEETKRGRASGYNAVAAPIELDSGGAIPGIWCDFEPATEDVVPLEIGGRTLFVQQVCRVDGNIIEQPPETKLYLAAVVDTVRRLHQAGQLPLAAASYLPTGTVVTFLSEAVVRGTSHTAALVAYLCNPARNLLVTGVAGFREANGADLLPRLSVAGLSAKSALKSTHRVSKAIAMTDKYAPGWTTVSSYGDLLAHTRAELS